MKSRLPQLRLRDLFWLVLVCAMAIGWWQERVKNEQLQRVKSEQLQRMHSIGDNLRDAEYKLVVAQAKRAEDCLARTQEPLQQLQQADEPPSD